MIRLPLLDRDLLCRLLTADIAAAELEKPATADDVARAAARLFGLNPAPSVQDLKLSPRPSLREVYAAFIDTDQFRAACGRISASYAW